MFKIKYALMALIMMQSSGKINAFSSEAQSVLGCMAVLHFAPVAATFMPKARTFVPAAFRCVKPVISHCVEKTSTTLNMSPKKIGIGVGVFATGCYYGKETFLGRCAFAGLGMYAGFKFLASDFFTNGVNKIFGNQKKDLLLRVNTLKEEVKDLNVGLKRIYLREESA